MSLRKMLIYKSRVFDLYSTNTSSQRPPFEYVGHPGSCAALIVTPDEKIGLLAHHREAVGRTLFELPAGTVDYEASLEDIMLRELREEAELKIDSQQLHRLTSVYPSPGYTSELSTLFLVLLTESQRKKNDSLRWFSRGELNTLIQSGEIADMKTVTAVLFYQLLVQRPGGRS